MLHPAPLPLALPSLINLFVAVTSYDTIYPIYLDAKAPHCAGGRRVPKSLALEWPLAESIAGACGKLGIQTVFEVSLILALHHTAASASSVTYVSSPSQRVLTPRFGCGPFRSR